MKREYIRRNAATTSFNLFLFVIFLFVGALLLISACAGRSPSQFSLGIFSLQKAAVVARELTTNLAAPIFPGEIEADIEGEEDALPAIVTAAKLNVRSGPGTGYTRVGFVSRNDELQVTGKTANCQWLRVITPSRLVGWVVAAYVSHDWTCDKVAVVVVTPLASTTPTRAPTKTTTVTAKATLLSADTPTATPTLTSGDTPTPTETPLAEPTDTPTLVSADTPTNTPPPASPTAPSFDSTPEPEATPAPEAPEESEATPVPEEEEEPEATPVPAEEEPEPTEVPAEPEE